MDDATKEVALALIGVVGTLGAGYLAYLGAKRSVGRKLSEQKNGDSNKSSGDLPRDSGDNSGRNLSGD